MNWTQHRYRELFLNFKLNSTDWVVSGSRLSWGATWSQLPASGVAGCQLSPPPRVKNNLSWLELSGRKTDWAYYWLQSLQTQLAAGGNEWWGEEGEWSRLEQSWRSGGRMGDHMTPQVLPVTSPWVAILLGYCQHCLNTLLITHHEKPLFLICYHDRAEIFPVSKLVDL